MTVTSLSPPASAPDSLKQPGRVAVALVWSVPSTSGCLVPYCRSPMSESDVAPNVGLRNATQHYLDEHPWAWHECI